MNKFILATFGICYYWDLLLTECAKRTEKETAVGTNRGEDCS